MYPKVWNAMDPATMEAVIAIQWYLAGPIFVHYRSQVATSWGNVFFDNFEDIKLANFEE